MRIRLLLPFLVFACLETNVKPMINDQPNNSKETSLSSSISMIRQSVFRAAVVIGALGWVATSNNTLFAMGSVATASAVYKVGGYFLHRKNNQPNGNPAIYSEHEIYSEQKSHAYLTNIAEIERNISEQKLELEAIEQKEDNLKNELEKLRDAFCTEQKNLRTDYQKQLDDIEKNKKEIEIKIQDLLQQINELNIHINKYVETLNQCDIDKISLITERDDKFKTNKEKFKQSKEHKEAEIKQNEQIELQKRIELDQTNTLLMQERTKLLLQIKDFIQKNQTSPLVQYLKAILADPGKLGSAACYRTVTNILAPNKKRAYDIISGGPTEAPPTKKQRKNDQCSQDEVNLNGQHSEVTISPVIEDRGNQ